MASSLDLSGLSKYTDQLSQALVRESVLGGETFKYITVIPNIKYADALNKLTTSFNEAAGVVVLYHQPDQLRYNKTHFRYVQLKLRKLSVRTILNNTG